MENWDGNVPIELDDGLDDDVDDPLNMDMPDIDDRLD